MVPKVPVKQMRGKKQISHTFMLSCHSATRRDTEN